MHDDFTTLMSQLQFALRLILIALAFFYILIATHKKANGTEALTWRSSPKDELVRNAFNIAIFTIGLTLLMAIDKEPVNRALDILILTCVCAGFVIPKKYGITDVGILAGGTFRRWQMITGYSERGNIVLLRQKHTLARLRVPVKDLKRTRALLERHLAPRISRP